MIRCPNPSWGIGLGVSRVLPCGNEGAGDRMHRLNPNRTRRSRSAWTLAALGLLLAVGGTATLAHAGTPGSLFVVDSGPSMCAVQTALAAQVSAVTNLFEEVPGDVRALEARPHGP